LDGTLKGLYEKRRSVSGGKLRKSIRRGNYKERKRGATLGEEERYKEEKRSETEVCSRGRRSSDPLRENLTGHRKFSKKKRRTQRSTKRGGAFFQKGNTKGGENMFGVGVPSTESVRTSGDYLGGLLPLT